MSKRLISWNVNGIRAIQKKGFLQWLLDDQPDVLCIQETKAQPEQLDASLTRMPGYHVFFASAERKGYSGVAVYSKEKPLRVHPGLGIAEFDSEGRTLICEYPDFILYNIYYPNGKASPERLDYKMRFYDAFLDHANGLKNQGKNLVICGDVNTAHTEIDLARPKENEKVSGFLPEERAWIDKFLSDGYVDTLRIFKKEGGHYSWWDYKTQARERNIGWRIDYFFVSESLKPLVRDGFILKDVPGSDHCPIGVELDLP
jgi:exodeoxyribonuclease-3